MNEGFRFNHVGDCQYITENTFRYNVHSTWLRISVIQIKEMLVIYLLFVLRQIQLQNAILIEHNYANKCLILNIHLIKCASTMSIGNLWKLKYNFAAILNLLLSLSEDYSMIDIFTMWQHFWSFSFLYEFQIVVIKMKRFSIIQKQFLFRLKHTFKWKRLTKTKSMLIILLSILITWTKISNPIHPKKEKSPYLYCHK